MPSIDRVTLRRARLLVVTTVATAVSVLMLALLPASASAKSSGGSNSYSLFGDAVLVHPGNNSPTAVQATYDGCTLSCETDPLAFGGVEFASPSGLTVSQLSNYSTDYQFTVGTCEGGAPRLGAYVTNGSKSGNIYFYIGPYPSYTGCPPNEWKNTGNLASPTNKVDASQLGGSFYEEYEKTQENFGSYKILELFVVVDGFSGKPITAQFDNVMINSTTYTFENANSCKKGGWQQFTASPGPFKNQGDCVSYFATGGKNA
jgi:hypothetical protein